MIIFAFGVLATLNLLLWILTAPDKSGAGMALMFLLSINIVFDLLSLVILGFLC